MRRPPSSCLALLLLASAPAWAEATQSREIVVRYSGPPDCSSAAAFIERTRPRLPTIALVERGQEVGLDVVLERTETGVQAELLIHLESGGTASRSILASSCDEATEAIAFVAAVALDPGAPEPVIVQSAEGSGSAQDGVLLAERATAPGARRPEIDDEQGERRRRRPRPVGARGSVGLLGVGAALGFGVAPEPMLGPDLTLRWSSRRGGVWSPGLLLGAHYLLSGAYRQPTGVASFHQGLARLELCPTRLEAGVLSFSPCLGLGGGWVQSEGTEVDVAAQVTRPYLETRLALHLELELGTQSAMILSGYVALPWIRDAYAFDTTVFHRTAAVTGGLALAIGARLW